MILEEGPAEVSRKRWRRNESRRTRRSGLSAVPWVVSARSAEALTAQADRLLAHVQAAGQLDPVDIGWSLARRSVFEHRAMVVGADRQQLMAGLAGVAPAVSRVRAW